ncbi:DegT/DnrJ/EryC1/StrS family aminotransferase [Pleomorphovibrio marinus]|uniref:DegT/DnrJ/EryC1/StrS family aminotransferase n=1 Tax=Pleomorphovibrio marinus TaxID=2164132 RepID=UPI000E0B32FB|nr:DegT/DnrJ/EryC1/StrS family aminotransferase [Pleomorphovibrio marinus]
MKKIADLKKTHPKGEEITDKKIWLSSPHMGDNEKKFVDQAFESNWVAPLGPNVNGFEEDIVHYTHCGHAAALTSGTGAIHLALAMLDVQPGDFVICQSFTFSASANPIRYMGAIPVFVDSEEETWNMCPDALLIAIQSCIDGTIATKYPHLDLRKEGQLPKAIIPVDLYGMPAKMEQINGIAKKFGIPVIEDAAEALGSSIDQKQCGTFGDIGIYSFNGNKIITTSGGGALVSQNRKYVERARFLSTQAREDAPHYEHTTLGYNYRLSNICAGIGRGQMQVLRDRVDRRREIFGIYREFFRGVKGISWLEEPQGFISNRWLSTILVNPNQTGGISRENIRLELATENIESRPLWKPMHLQPVFCSFPYVGNGISDSLFENGLCLPSGSNMNQEDIERILRNLRIIFKH